jgi:hypothetical protein
VKTPFQTLTFLSLTAGKTEQQAVAVLDKKVGEGRNSAMFNKNANNNNITTTNNLFV